MDFVGPDILLIVLLPFGGFALYGFSTFDRIVRLECERFPEEWQRDGSPGVIYGTPAPGIPRTWRSGLAAQRCMLVWLFVTPEWARENPEANRAMRKFRVCCLLSNFVAVPLYGLTMMLIVYVAQ
jgi:hypothetical protein